MTVRDEFPTSLRMAQNVQRFQRVELGRECDHTMSPPGNFGAGFDKIASAKPEALAIRFMRLGRCETEFA